MFARSQSGFSSHRCTSFTHLLVGLEDIALEDVAGAVPRDVAPDLEVLRVVRHVENPGTEPTCYMFTGNDNVDLQSQVYSTLLGA